MKRLVLAVAALLVALAAAPTQTPSATSSSQPLPAFSGTGTLSASGTSAEGKKGTLQTQIRIMHRDVRWRIDLLKAAVTADDPFISAMAQMLPKVVLTAVADPQKKTLTIWSAARPLYFQTALAIPKAKPKPKPSSSPSPSPIWDNVMKSLNSMTQYDSFTQSFALVGHQTVNGRMASVYHFSSQMQKHGGKLETTTGDVAFADDLSGLPIHLSMNLKAQVVATLAIDLTDVSKQTPDAAQFVPPPGYKRTIDFGAVMNGTGQGK